MRRFSRSVAWFPAAALAAGPVLAFLVPAVPAAIAHPPEGLLPPARAGTLLLRTAVLGLLAGGLAVLLGGSAAVRLAGASGRARAAGMALLPLPLLLPRGMLALAAAALGGRSVPSGGAEGLLLSAGVLAAAWSPVVALAVLADLEALPAPLLEAASLAGSPSRVWWRGILPGLGPVLAVSGAFAAAAAVTEYGVPATFQVPVWATELVAELSLGPSPTRIAALAMPLLLPAAGVLVLLARAARRLPAAVEAGPSALPPEPRWLRAVTALPALAVLAIPLAVVVVLARTAGSPAMVGRGLAEGGRSILASGGTAAGAGALAAAAAYPVARAMLVALRPWVFALCLLPAVLPAPLHGLGAAALLGPFPGGVALTVALAGRVLPFVLAVLLLLLRRGDPGPREAASLVTGPLARLRLGLRLARHALAAAWAVGAALAFGELGVTVLMAPPGAPPFAVRLFNLLHYGAGDAAAGLALAALPLPLAAWAAAAAAGRRVA